MVQHQEDTELNIDLRVTRTIPRKAWAYYNARRFDEAQGQVKNTFASRTVQDHSGSDADESVGR
jgi:hypothetical protein